MSDSQFCPHCEVTMDLHDGPDSCTIAENRARFLESWGFGGGVR